MNRAKFVFLAVIAGVAWGLKRHYAMAEVGDLAWILAPVAKLSALVSGAHFEWEPGAGYLAREHFFLIAKPCAGLNFMIAAFGMIGVLLAERVKTMRAGALLMVAGGLTAYAVTIVTNTLRIVVALWLAAHPVASGWWTAARVHRLEGVVVYFGALVLLHAAFQSAMPRKALEQSGTR